QLHQDEPTLLLDAIDPGIQERRIDSRKNLPPLFDQTRRRIRRHCMAPEMLLHPEVAPGGPLECSVTVFAREEHQRPLPKRLDLTQVRLNEDLLRADLFFEPGLILV